MSRVPMSLGELFGPAKCEHEDCRADAWIIWMTQAEYNAAKSQDDIHPINYVFRNKIGTAFCEDHK